MIKSVKKLALICGATLSILLVSVVPNAHGKNVNFSLNNNVMSEAESTVNNIHPIKSESAKSNPNSQNNSVAQNHGLHDGRNYNIVPNKYKSNLTYARSYVSANHAKSNDHQVESYQGYKSNHGAVHFNSITSNPSLARSYHYGIQASNHEYHRAMDESQSHIYEHALFQKSNLKPIYWSPYQTSILYNNGNQHGRFGSSLFVEYPFHRTICFNHSHRVNAYGYHGLLNGIAIAKHRNSNTQTTMRHLRHYLWANYHESPHKARLTSKRFHKDYRVIDLSCDKEHSYPTHYLIYNKHNINKSSVIYIIPYGKFGELPQI